MKLFDLKTISVYFKTILYHFLFLAFLITGFTLAYAYYQKTMPSETETQTQTPYNH